MREVIEMEITKFLNDTTEKKILNTDLVSFDKKKLDISQFRHSKYLGTPFFLEKDILKLSTQMYYEGIPLSEMNKNTQVILYKRSREKLELLAEGTVRSKYYISAEEDDWGLEEALDSNNCDRLDVKIKITQKEKEMLELGIIPLSMDDKWFQYCKDNRFSFIRSWTGIEIFRGQILPSKTENEWVLCNITSNKSFFMSMDKEEKENLLRDLIKYPISRKMKLHGLKSSTLL
ncbi:hypothetical protein WAF17_04785 [Bernardetia sp. ABR2-2B]|uniref:hypothetical protein n=1 Tax=Bernardetia sp. ABR2-2B TaxID=3127472 RepID=UPI0030CFDE65